MLLPSLIASCHLRRCQLAALLLAILILDVDPAFAQNDKMRRGPVPDWVKPSKSLELPENATGLVFVRRHETLVHLDEQGQAQYQGYRIRLLHPNALQLGNIAIKWNPSAGAPVVHLVQVHREDETIDVLKQTSFEIMRREDQLEAASLDGLLTAVLRIPDLRVGDELEVGLTIRSKDPTLGFNESGMLVLAPDPAPGRFRLGLSWAEGREPKLKMTPDIAAIAERSGREINVRFDNPPMLAPPKDAPARFRLQRAVEYSNFDDWPSISRLFAPLYDKAATLKPGSSLKSEASRIAKTHALPIDRAGAALKLVQRDVRYIYVGLDGGNLTPATAEETWQRRYGDCKGKTALLMALLSELGIASQPVLANNTGLDDGFDERLPSAGLFDHVLVRARIDGTDYWLDGTLPPGASPSSTPVMPYRWVLPLSRQGNSIEHLKWSAPSTPDEVTLFELDARKGFDQPARMTSTMIVRGIKGLVQEAQLSGLTSAQLLNAMRQQMIGNFWQSIEDVRWRYDAKARASVMTITGTGTLDWDNEDAAKSLTLPGGGFNPPERRVRPAGQDEAVPFVNDPEFECRVTTVRLPESTKTSNWSVNTSFNARMFGKRYYRAFSLRDGTISMVRGSRVEQLEIDPITAKQDNAKIASFDNSMARIEYDPARTASAVTANAAVPATYDIDWSANDVPCLPSLATR
jgi:transglutaminase-like putative cysteine protease